MEAWEKAVGSTVIATIALANYGRWPRSLDDWSEVAHRHGLYLTVGPHGTFLCEQAGLQVAFIKRIKNRRKMHNRISHEVAEYLISMECNAPYNFKENPRSRHSVACYVQAYDRRVRKKALV